MAVVTHHEVIVLLEGIGIYFLPIDIQGGFFDFNLFVTFVMFDDKEVFDQILRGKFKCITFSRYP